MIVHLLDKKNETWIIKKDITCIDYCVDGNTFKLDGTIYDKNRYELHSVYSEDW